MPSAHPGSPLLERDVELGAFAAAMAGARDGTGRMVVLEGPPGAGKTALLDAFAAAALDPGGMIVRRARGSELARDRAFGGARELLSGMAGDSGGLAGPSLPAAPVLAAGDASVAPPPAFAVLAGLAAVVEDRAQSTPVVLLLDDVQWMDAPTLRFLDSLRGRLGRLSVVAVLAVRAAAVRQGEPPLSEILADPEVELWSLAPLGLSAIAALLEERIGRAPEPGLVASCAEATGGNPFAVRELIAALSLGEASSDAGRLSPRVPATIARSIRGRLARLDPDAIRIAGVLAVLGDGAPLHRVAALAEIDAERVRAAADVLAAAELIAPERPLAFVHPLVRSAIEEDLSSGERARLHARAGARLAEEGADPEAVGAHLLRTDAVGDPVTVTHLRSAGAIAVRRGAPDVAVVYLERALREPPAAGERASLTHELGRAELLARSPACVGRLKDALSLVADPVGRGRVGVDLIDAMMFAGAFRDALGLAETLRAALDGSDGAREVGAALDRQIALGLLERADAATSPEVRRLEALATAGEGGGPARVLFALVLALRGERCDEVPGIVAAGLDDGRMLAEHTADSMAAVHGVDALVFVDALAEASALTEAMSEDAARHGLVLGAVAADAHAGLVGLRRGDLARARDVLFRALERARSHELPFVMPFVCAYLGEVLGRRGELEEAVEVLGFVPEMALAMNSAAATTFLWARAHVALLRGDLAGAEADLRACGEYAERIGALNPVVEPWRSQLALVLAAAGDRPGSSAEPAELVAAELAIALRSGLARGVGVALRAQGVLAGGAEGVDLLAESVTVLRGSPAVLELAESLRAHGAALRRLGRVLEAREVLREALDLAMRCGAGALVAQVRSELHVAGARPRGPWTHGVEALTPSELRVARLAALGLTNPEIASELVVSVKTVKHHLGAVFRKLDVASRRDLAGVVDPADTHLDNSHEPLLSMRVHRGVEQSGSSSGS